MSNAMKFMPVKSPESAPFWEGMSNHKILIPVCKDCDATHFYPRPQCPKCWSTNLDWKEIEPRATLFTWTTVYQSFHEGWVDDVPFVVAIVEVKPGVKMMTNIVECDPEVLKMGMELEAVFDDVKDTVTLLKFRPATR